MYWEWDKKAPCLRVQEGPFADLDEVVPPDLNGSDAPSLEELREPTSVLGRYDLKLRSSDE